jgi:uncharacterized protein (TIGR00375 family)
MEYIADLHIHSKYSRATSVQTDLDNLALWAKIKGIQILGTGDFTHPEWFSQIKQKLEPAEEGLFKLKEGNSTRFVLTTELSCIYTKNDQVRKIHVLILAPSIKTVEKINAQLSWSSNLRSDGRPILGMDAKELLKLVLESSPDCLFIPAHIWTPWFSLFGSRSGFDSVEECFEELSPNIHALETGLSSDPEMNWRLSKLDKYTLVSNSDCHSPQKTGREANIFEGDNISYNLLKDAIKRGGREKGLLNFIKTIEFFPDEGKYHYDGHRVCQIRMSPEERKKCGGICPVCQRPLTVGVLSRVDELADRDTGTAMPPGAIPFIKIVPLAELIAQAMGMSSTTSKAVEEEYQTLIGNFGNEFNILLNVSVEEINKISSETAQAIKMMREHKLNILPGFDGEYGKVGINEIKEEKSVSQTRLF